MGALKTSHFKERWRRNLAGPVVRTRDHYPEQRWVRLIKARDGVKRHGAGIAYIERESDVQDDPLAASFYFDAGATNLTGASVNAEPHGRMILRVR